MMTDSSSSATTPNATNRVSTDQLSIEQEAALLSRRRLWYFLALALLAFSLLAHEPLAFLAALFTVIIGIVPSLWYRQALRHLVMQQYVSQPRLFLGEDVILSIRVENRKLLPLPWLQVENAIAPPLTVLSRRNSQFPKVDQDVLESTWLLWSYQRVTRRYRLRCHARGYHTFGPIRLRSADPFGWMETELLIPSNTSLLVYPLIAPLETLGLPSVHPLGEHSAPRQLLEDPLRVAGVRDYMIGDDPRRIHWKATARSGELRSKIYETSSLRRLLILLDVWNYSSAWSGPDPELQELTISVAASLAVWALEEGYMVALFSNSAIRLSPDAQTEQEAPTSKIVEFEDENFKKATTLNISPPGISIPFSRDYGQSERILTTLARLAPRYHAPIERFIDSEDTMFPMGTTAVLVSAGGTLNEATVERLLDRRAKGTSVHLILTGDISETGAVANENKQLTELYDLPVHYPGGKEKWHELVRNVGAGGTAGTSTTSIQLD